MYSDNWATVIGTSHTNGRERANGFQCLADTNDERFSGLAHESE